MQRAVIILPTYNEKDNIRAMLLSILGQQSQIETHELHVLVVDDSSPDGTGIIVEDFTKTDPNIHLIKGRKQGLGKAYVRGFEHAIYQLHADVIFEMDADFSHNPNDLPRLIREINDGADFVIGSRYVEGGSIPEEWSLLRKLNSKWGNIFARHVAGLKNIKDCTGGFRAIKANVIKKINMRKLRVKGYAFQISLLDQVLKSGVIVKEIPIQFSDRIYGTSKISMADISEFIISTFLIRFSYNYIALFKKIVLSVYIGLLFFFLGCVSTFVLLFALSHGYISMEQILIAYIVSIGFLMSMHNIFNIYLMLYAWEDIKRLEEDAPSKIIISPTFSFSAIIPVRHEEHVIADTIKAVSRIYYPEHLKETLIICKSDDFKTIMKVQDTIESLNKPNVRLIVFDDEPINKPHSLNIGFQHAKNDILVVFDAEDQPSRYIYQIANTQMIHKNLDVLQSGVQLMNFRSSWFSTLNVLEYYFWFKSALHFFAKKGIIPLGGNTVFFKKVFVKNIGGWDEQCLTEDADIGIRLSVAGANIGVVYDERHSTQEETPPNLKSFIKQRTRWNQGFMQLLLKGDWRKLNNLSQRLLAFYLLISPQLQALFVVLIPLSIISAIHFELPILVTLFTTLPLLLLFLQIVINNIGLYEFTRGYKISYSILMPFKIFATFYPFQFILGISALRSIIRVIIGNDSWEKTLHINAHRPEVISNSIIPSFNLRKKLI